MDIASFGMNEWVAVGSALLALLSFLFNFAVVNRQTAMQAEALRAHMDAELQDWAQEAVDTLSEACAFAERHAEWPVEPRGARVSLLWRLSAIADKGRLFFPNLAPDHHGADKEGAFKGFRPPVLDAVIFAFQMLERMDVRNLGPDLETAGFIRDCRRALISEVQRAVDPRRRGRMLERLAKAGRKLHSDGLVEASALAERLEMRYPGTLVTTRGAAWVAQMKTLSAKK
jgi:hypothetical protein